MAHLAWVSCAGETGGPALISWGRVRARARRREVAIGLRNCPGPARTDKGSA